MAAFVALGGGAFVLTTQRGFNPAVPAIAAPIAIAWPHGAPALGAGVALGALTLARPRRLPGPALFAALAFAILIAATGDGGLVRGGAAAIAIAVVVPAYVRTVEDLVLAGLAFGVVSAAVALGAGVAGVGGVRADLIAVSAAAGLASAAAAGARAVPAAALAGVLVLPSKAGVVAAAVAIVGLLILRRLPLLDAILAAVAVAIAWVAGAPFAHAPWRSLNAFSDTYHRLGTAGVALFVLLLATTAWGLPRPYAPSLLATLAGAIFAPVEATAPLFLLAGFAATGSSPEGPLRRAQEEQRLLQRERELDAARQLLTEEQRRLRRRRQALDEREAQLGRREPPPAALPPPPDESRDAELEARERAIAARELGVVELEAELHSREEGLSARERAAVLPEAPEPDADLAARESALREREQAVAAVAEELRRRDEELTARERAVARRAAERERELVAPVAAPPPPPPPPEPVLPPPLPPEPEYVPERIPTPVPAVAGILQPEPGRWNLAALAMQVEERAGEYPAEVEEWRLYLAILSPYAEDGILPERFDATVGDVFGPLLKGA